ncbi:hypothetical protein B7460_21715 [Klebsiella pneumoniae]|nr:hypothetical protein B7460_21715 [Klebsiella pneumoniae]
MTPVDYILRESKNCNMWWTHTPHFVGLHPTGILRGHDTCHWQEFRYCPEWLLQALPALAARVDIA